MSGVNWDKESTFRLFELWHARVGNEWAYTTGQIAVVMKRSKMSITAKAHREGWKRDNPINPAIVAPRAMRKRERLEWGRPNISLPSLGDPIIALAPRELYPEPVCCWPIGEPGTKEFRYCEAACEQRGDRYCPEHKKIAYVKAA